MRAELVIRRRVAFGNRDFLDMVVWRVPEPVPPSVHRYRYRFVHVVDGRRVVGFDNERGKGDHRHLDGDEYSYVFVDVDVLTADFLAAVRRWRAEHGRT